MAERQFSVRVSPGRWDGEIDALAQRLARVTGMAAGPIEQALGRGPMTVDADLRRDEAERLMERLSRASIPCDVVREEGTADKVVARGEPAPRETQTDRAGEPQQEFGPPDTAGQAPESGTSDSASELTWNVGAADDGGVDARDAKGTEPPSLTELSGGGRPPADTAGSSTSDAQPIEPDGTGPGVDSESSSEEAGGASPAAFDGAQLEEALSGGEEERRPYEPEGYDNRTPHLPLLAAALSLVAPGAGQTYNGEANRGARYAFRALLVYPWIQSVRDAWQVAVEIREYQRPYPEARNLGRAMGHLGAMWAVAATVVVAGWIGVETWRAGWRAEQRKSRQANVAEAIDEAKLQVRTARVETWDALDRAGPGAQDYTMSEKERAQRLFRIGLEHCRAREFDMCEATMRRVSSLDDSMRAEAIRLQVWANAQKNTADQTPLPDVGVRETLREYDRRMLQSPDAGR